MKPKLPPYVPRRDPVWRPLSDVDKKFEREEFLNRLQDNARDTKALVNELKAELQFVRDHIPTDTFERLNVLAEQFAEFVNGKPVTEKARRQQVPAWYVVERWGTKHQWEFVAQYRKKRDAERRKAKEEKGSVGAYRVVKVKR